MRAKLITLALVTIAVSALPCRCSDEDFLTTTCRFAKRCLQERVWIAQESQRLRTVSTNTAKEVNSRVEQLAERVSLYDQVCHPHMGDFLDLLKSPPGGTETLEKCCGKKYRKEMEEILAELPLAKAVEK